AIDPDTFVGEASYRAALHAAGGACAMARDLLRGAASVGFCGVRPSGHPAGRVHRGTGRGEIFRARSDVLFASIHQTRLFPGTGPLEDAGSGAGEGYTLNLPVPPGSEEPLWLGLIDRVVLPAARAFEPDLVLVSAGFDAHAEDPLAECRLQTSSFVAMAARVRDLAGSAGIPLGVVLEGGYNRRVLAEC